MQDEISSPTPSPAPPIATNATSIAIATTNVSRQEEEEESVETATTTSNQEAASSVIAINDNGNDNGNNNENSNNDTIVATNDTTSPSSSPSPSPSSTPSRFKKVLWDWKVILILPYFIGLIWTMVHPIISILTGEMKCRGWYLDENSILMKYPNLGSLHVPNHFKSLESSVLLRGKTTSSTTTTSTSTTATSQNNNLCDLIEINNIFNVDCYTHNYDLHNNKDNNNNNGINSFQVASIIPLANAIEPTDETIVFVVSSTATSSSSSNDASSSSSSTSSDLFYQALIKSLEILADPIQTPWLAKTFYLVSSSSSSSSSSSVRSLEDTVSDFLSAYYGTSSSSSSSSVPPLPPHLCKGILRNLIAIEIVHHNHDTNITTTTTTTTTSVPTTATTTTATELSILPHGRHGVLPNADLVFLVGKLFSQATFLNPRRKQQQQQQQSLSTSPLFVTHAYPHYSFQVQQWTAANSEYFQSLSSATTVSNSKSKYQTWLEELVDMVLFGMTSSFGPFPPHAPALNIYGIDSISIRAKFTTLQPSSSSSSQSSLYTRDPTIEMVQYMEYLLHSLSNLHERLHHSFTLYWLPSPYKFVSHIEYLLPILLILLPLAIRSFGLIFIELSTSSSTSSSSSLTIPNHSSSLHLTILGCSVLATGTLMVSTMMVSTMIKTMFDNDNNNDDSSMKIKMMNTWWIILYSAIIYWFGSMLSSSPLQSSQQEQLQENSNDNQDDTSNRYPNDSNNANENHHHFNNKNQKERMLQTLQFTSCTIAVYTLVPVAFAHGALAYLPAMIWTPILAIPKYWQWDINVYVTNTNTNTSTTKKNLWKIIFWFLPTCLLAIVSSPPITTMILDSFLSASSSSTSNNINHTTYDPYTSPLILFVHAPLNLQLWFLLLASVML